MGQAALAGVIGGIFVGFVDGTLAVLGSSAWLSGTRPLQIVLLAIAAAGTAGAGVSAGFAILNRLARISIAHGPAAQGMRASGAWPTVVTAIVVFLPVLIYDAIAMFKGSKAAAIPGHHIISGVLVVVGVVAMALFTRAYLRAVAAVSRFVPGAVAVALLVVSTASAVANFRILPRLYPWFHHTLSGLSLASAVLAAWAALSWRRAPRGFAVASAALVLVAAVLSYPTLGTSTEFRFAAIDKTMVTGLVLRALPLPRLRSQPPPAASTTTTDEGDPGNEPLPAGPSRPDADVLLITIDAVRAGHVGAYGYPRATTPHIDKLASRGVRFERAYAQAPHTSFSIASLLTGKYYATLARLSSGGADEPLPSTLRRYGWRTAAFYPPAVFFVDGEKLAGFRDSQFQFEYVKFEFLDAFDRLDQIEAYFDSVKPRRSFLWVHFFEPHEPYETRAGHDFGAGDVDRYDSEIAYTDAAVGKLVAYFERTRPGAVIVVTSDHGEEFDDHGGRYHGTTLYEEQIRVPLIIVVPGIAPHVVSGPVELVDIAPTLMEMLGIPIPARIRGTDLGPWLAFPPAASQRLPPAFAELDRLRMIVSGTDKLVCRQDSDSCELFDLANDPGETRNLGDAEPARFASLRARLDVWLAEQSRLEPVAGFPGKDGVVVPTAIERGRLGDISAASELLRLATTVADVDVRGEAARTLAMLPPPATLRNALVKAVTAAPGDDWLAIAALAAGSEDAAVAARASAILTRDGEIAVHAALALADRGRTEGLPIMTRALVGCTPAELCRRIVTRLGSLRDGRAVPALIGHIADVMTRRDVVAALGEIGDDRALDSLARCLIEDEYVPVRAEAARALVRLQPARSHARVAALLRRALQREKETQVRVAIQQGIADLARPR